jgi:hypothetical protein
MLDPVGNVYEADTAVTTMTISTSSYEPVRGSGDLICAYRA